MKYTIKENRKDWNPIEFPRVYFPRRGSKWTIDIEFTESCWYNWLPDRDQSDWNKVGGVTNALSLNNVDSVLIGWRPIAEQPNKFQLTPYFNIGSGIDSMFPPVTVALNQRVRAIITYLGKRKFEIKFRNLDTGEESTPVSRKVKRFWMGRKIGMNMGGANNSDGPYGGKASQNMEMYVSTWYKR